MTNPIISTYDHATGQTTETEMTDSQLQLQVARVAKQAKTQAAKDKARQIILDRLGITADEAQLLLG